MPYADTDFWLGLLKNDDWLGENAEKYYKIYKEELRTSIITFIEIFSIEEDFNFNRIKAVNNILEVADIKKEKHEYIIFQAEQYRELGANTLDAFHAAFAKNKIISSDKIYEDLGLTRIPLEDPSYIE